MPLQNLSYPLFVLQSLHHTLAQSLQGGERQRSRLGSLCCCSSIATVPFESCLLMPTWAVTTSAPASAQAAALLLSPLLVFFFFFLFVSFSSSQHLPPFLKHVLAEAPCTLWWAVWRAAVGGFARCGAGWDQLWADPDLFLPAQVALQTHTQHQHLPTVPDSTANEFFKS